jgi:Holliday junction resolvase RusA-like endonuclease
VKAPYFLNITIPGLPSTPNSRRHWRQVHRENTLWYALVKYEVGKKKPEKPLEKAKLTLTRASSSEGDFDNLAASFKCVLDGLRYCGVLIDDKKRNVGTPEYQWEKAPPKKGFIRIQVEEVV